MQPEGMSPVDAVVEPDVFPSGKTNRRRFRFGLKWLFVLIAILCAGLGAYAILERQAREMLARNDAIQATIQDNMTRRPPDVDFVNPAAVRRSKSEIAKRRSAPRPQRGAVSRVFGGSRYDFTSTNTIQLDIADTLAAPNAPNGQNIALKLLDHYGNGLAELGLQRTSTMTGAGPTAASIWQIPKHGVNVLIDVNLDPPAKHANVRVIFIHDDRVSIW